MPIHIIDLFGVLTALRNRKRGQCSLELATFADLMMDVDPLFACKVKMENEQVLSAEEYLIIQIASGEYLKREEMN